MMKFRFIGNFERVGFLTVTRKRYLSYCIRFSEGMTWDEHLNPVILWCKPRFESCRVDYDR